MCLAGTSPPPSSRVPATLRKALIGTCAKGSTACFVPATEPLQPGGRILVPRFVQKLDYCRMIGNLH